MQRRWKTPGNAERRFYILKLPSLKRDSEHFENFTSCNSAGRNARHQEAAHKQLFKVTRRARGKRVGRNHTHVKAVYSPYINFTKDGSAVFDRSRGKSVKFLQRLCAHRPPLLGDGVPGCRRKSTSPIAAEYVLEFVPCPARLPRVLFTRLFTRTKRHGGVRTYIRTCMSIDFAFSRGYIHRISARLVIPGFETSPNSRSNFPRDYHRVFYFPLFFSYLLFFVTEATENIDGYLEK
ncbi:hypothetical protein PUN28_018068 [Cardiocondyla obscurior]|uniref:Uncharacterized protein n=1 Tax=Cardiocondyla obscurior TaxID=286306 RepID=A0AAW2EFP1_9HYME